MSQIVLIAVPVAGETDDVRIAILDDAVEVRIDEAQQSQSIDPSRETSAALRQSPMIA